MHVLAITSAMLIVLAAGCRSDSESTDARAAWLQVLTQKKAAAAPGASPAARQAYADALAAFVQKHPQHGRARAVYQRIQLDFARELAERGRHRDAIRFYDAVLKDDPRNEEAARGLETSAQRIALPRARLRELQRGMSQREVTRLLGRPIPGWSIRHERRAATIEAWYYRTADGSIAGLYFRDGALFAAEENAEAKSASSVSR